MMNTTNTTNGTTAATVDTLTPRKAEQRKAHGAARWAYNNGTSYGDIFDAYGKPSAAKVDAWERCKRICAAFNGEALRNVGKNCMKFSAVFQYVERATGALCYCYITRDYVRHCYA